MPTPIGGKSLEGHDCGVPDLKEADVPNGIFPVPEFRSTPGRHGVSLGTRIRTRLRRNRLDDELARGADPGATAQLSLRAAQLRSHKERSRLANALVETLGEARRGEPVTLRVRPQRAEVRASADDLLALVARLRDGQPIDVRGAAMTALLVDHSASPLRRDGGQDLQQELRAARIALDTPDRVTHGLQTAA
jgi:hypothetical protein